MRHGSVLVPSALATVGSALAFWYWQADQGFWVLPASSMPVVTLAVAARFWLGLSASATALDVIRAGGRWRPTRWVPATTTFQVAVVSMALTIPILACLVFLIVPGVWLALRWSQAWLTIVDGEAAWFDAAERSAELMTGRYWMVLGIWVALGLGYAAVAWLVQQLGEIGAALSSLPATANAVELAARVGLDALGYAVIAAIYDQLGADPAVGDPSHA